MKVSLSWLRQYVSVDMEIDRLSDALTMAGLEVDAVWDRYDDMEKVFVGRIEAVRPHPNADKLRLCDVAIKDRKVTVVCGAPNAEAGMLSALALPGTRLADGSVLEASTIRGAASEGMLCSEAELGLGKDRSGIMALDAGLSVGERLARALNLSDPVMEIELTPNRPDCLSIIGIAREVAAICGARMHYPEIAQPHTEDRIEDYTSVTIEAPDHCPRYAAALVCEATVGPSPDWIQQRLLSVGLRPINNIVDITNFVMMETGQPLHAFDFDRLAEHRIVVRTAAPSESFTTLDGKARSLTSDMLMICDGEKPVAVGGVMGGENSEIDAGTSRVLIESAYFHPASIRRTAKALGLGTDASHRFERGVDPEGTLTALKRAAALTAEIGGGQLIGGIIDVHPKPTPAKTLSLSAEATNRLLGTDLTAEQITGLLSSIDFSVAGKKDGALSVSVPTFRVDVRRPEDLMEEVARLWGYNRIPQTSPLIPAQKPPRTERRDFRGRIRTLLTGFGFTETVNYSFAASRAVDLLQLDPQDRRRRSVALLNPLTEDQSVMRTTLTSGLLETVRRNLTRQMRDLKLFEIGKAFIDNGPGQLPEEIEILGGILTGRRFPLAWHSEDVPCDFYDIKGAVEGLLEGLSVDGVGFTRLPDEACDYFRPGRSARILARSENIGIVGEVHPAVMKHFDIDQTVFLFEIELERLRSQMPDTVCAAPIPRFPAVSRDITLILDEDTEARLILDRLKDMNEPLVERVALFDVFTGSPVAEGKKSLSFRITYRSHEKTLEDESVNRLHQKISKALLEEFDAVLPG